MLNLIDLVSLFYIYFIFFGLALIIILSVDMVNTNLESGLVLISALETIIVLSMLQTQSLGSVMNNGQMWLLFFILLVLVEILFFIRLISENVGSNSVVSIIIMVIVSTDFIFLTSVVINDNPLWISLSLSYLLEMSLIVFLIWIISVITFIIFLYSSMFLEFVLFLFIFSHFQLFLCFFLNIKVFIFSFILDLFSFILFLFFYNDNLCFTINSSYDLLFLIFLVMVLLGIPPFCSYLVELEVIGFFCSFNNVSTVFFLVLYYIVLLLILLPLFSSLSKLDTSYSVYNINNSIILIAMVALFIYSLISTDIPFNIDWVDSGSGSGSTWWESFLMLINIIWLILESLLGLALVLLTIYLLFAIPSLMVALGVEILHTILSLIGFIISTILEWVSVSLENLIMSIQSKLIEWVELGYGDTFNDLLIGFSLFIIFIINFYIISVSVFLFFYSELYKSIYGYNLLVSVCSFYIGHIWPLINAVIIFLLLVNILLITGFIILVPIWVLLQESNSHIWDYMAISFDYLLSSLNNEIIGNEYVSGFMNETDLSFHLNEINYVIMCYFIKIKSSGSIISMVIYIMSLVVFFLVMISILGILYLSYVSIFFLSYNLITCWLIFSVNSISGNLFVILIFLLSIIFYLLFVIPITIFLLVLVFLVGYNWMNYSCIEGVSELMILVVLKGKGFYNNIMGIVYNVFDYIFSD